MSVGVLVGCQWAVIGGCQCGVSGVLVGCQWDISGVVVGCYRGVKWGC